MLLELSIVVVAPVVVIAVADTVTDTFFVLLLLLFLLTRVFSAIDADVVLVLDLNKTGIMLRE